MSATKAFALGARSTETCTQKRSVPKRRPPVIDGIWTRCSCGSGVNRSIYGAVDQDGTVLGVLVQHTRCQSAAHRFIQQLVDEHGQPPREVVTDKLRSYVGPCATLLAQATHRRARALNNRAENSHQPTRLRKRLMRGFKSVQHAQRFLSVFSAMRNFFNVSEHTLSAANRRTLQARRMKAWAAVVAGDFG